MHWNVAPEYISLLFISILIMYSRGYNLIPSLKNKMFRICLYSVFFEIILSIASIHTIEYYQVVPELANQTIQTLFFLSSPLLAVLFLLYVISVVREDDPKIYRYFRLAFIPYILYAVIVLANPTTEFLYSISASSGFMNGSGFYFTYVIPMLYAFAMIIIIFFNGKRIDSSIEFILLSFPIISAGMIGVQWLLPTIILSGSAATSALLIVYLYIQNKQIFIDDLTGLQNRKTFSKILEINVNRTREMNIVLISLDNFKAVNDRFGQLDSDCFLKAISEFLMKVVPSKTIYRYSGDEFVIILGNLPSDAVIDIVGIIRKRFNELWDCTSHRAMLEASISVVRFPEHADTEQSIITLLEYCNDLSKSNGKGKDVFADCNMKKALERKTYIIDLMKRGLTQDLFEIHFQPIYSMKRGRFIQAEALLRLSDRELGAISPGEFIPLAEESGLIVDIGYLLLNKVCRFIKELEEKGVEFDSISCNLSPLQFCAEGFADKTLEIINSSGINKMKLHLEITESVFIDNFANVATMMKQLNQDGIRFNLDDFGTGYSNIANIVQLPFECIKIDKSILYESVVSRKCFTIIQGLAKMFLNVGMKVIVEGVETVEHRQLVEQLNVDYIQGFLFARPMPAVDAIRYLEKDKQ